VPLGGRLRRDLDRPVHVGNDANLAALGEWKHGAGRGVDDLIYMTISTGIGGGVISGGRLVTGAHGLASEPGHFPIQPGGPMCACGQPGHLEAIASGTAIARRAGELLLAGEASSMQSSPDAEAVAAAAAKGDALAKRVLGEAGEALGRALAGFVHLFNPQRIILGGGVVRAGEPFLGPARAALRASVMDPAFLESVEVVLAALGDDSGLIGALTLATIE
jgi:glucokinase